MVPGRRVEGEEVEGGEEEGGGGFGVELGEVEDCVLVREEVSGEVSLVCVGCGEVLYRPVAALLRLLPRWPLLYTIANDKVWMWPMRDFYQDAIIGIGIKPSRASHLRVKAAPSPRLPLFRYSHNQNSTDFACVREFMGMMGAPCRWISSRG